MLNLLKERFIEYAIILALVVTVGFLGYHILQTQDLMLINKEAKENVTWCEKNGDGCSICRHTSSQAIETMK